MHSARESLSGGGDGNPIPDARSNSVVPHSEGISIEGSEHNDPLLTDNPSAGPGWDSIGLYSISTALVAEGGGAPNGGELVERCKSTVAVVAAPGASISGRMPPAFNISH